MEVKRVNPIVGMLSTCDALKDQALGNEWWRHDTLTDEIGDTTVDTILDCFDTGKPETGINRDGSWIIVEQYYSEEAARAGHAKWVKAITENPMMDLKDIHVWKMKEEEE